MIGRVIDGAVMLVCAFLFGWHLVPSTPRPAPAQQPVPAATAPAPVPVAECPEVREPAPPPPRRSSAVDPSGLPAVYLEIIGLPAR